MVKVGVAAVQKDLHKSKDLRLAIMGYASQAFLRYLDRGTLSGEAATRLGCELFQRLKRNDVLVQPKVWLCHDDVLEPHGVLAPDVVHVADDSKDLGQNPSDPQREQRNNQAIPGASQPLQVPVGASGLPHPTWALMTASPARDTLDVWIRIAAYGCKIARQLGETESQKKKVCHGPQSMAATHQQVKLLRKPACAGLQLLDALPGGVVHPIQMLGLHVPHTQLGLLNQPSDIGSIIARDRFPVSRAECMAETWVLP